MVKICKLPCLTYYFQIQWNSDDEHELANLIFTENRTDGTMRLSTPNEMRKKILFLKNPTSDSNVYFRLPESFRIRFENGEIVNLFQQASFSNLSIERKYYFKTLNNVLFYLN